MTLKTTLSLTLIATLIILSAGCIEYTEQTDNAITKTKIDYKPIIIDDGIDKSIKLKTTTNIDYYDEDGIHITGQTIYYGDELIEMRANMNGYYDGMKMTGTISQMGNNDPYYNMKCEFNEYEDGLNMRGIITIKGSNMDNLDSMCMDGIISGYVEGYPVTGTMSGCSPYIKMEINVQTPFGNYNSIEYIDI